jgi:hypothetical protein
MDILTKAAGSDIHADVWWVYEQTHKSEQYKFKKSLLFRADSELQEAKKDGRVKQNLFRQGFFSKSPRELDSVQLEKNKRTFVNRVNALEKELSPKELEVGRKIDLRTIQEEPYRELYNLLFEGDEKVLVRLKSGIGEREDKSIIFSKKLKKVMEDLAKYGVNVSVKNRIGEMREQLASTSKVMQRYLLEGKGNLKADIAHLFHAKGAEYDDETESWTELVEYSGKPSIKILEDIYQNASIPIIRIGEKEKGIKGLQTYYSLDVDEFVDEIHSLISSASEDPAEHFKLFYNADNVVRMIYRLIPDILHHNQEKMAENEKKEILTKHFDVLEYLIRINDLTGNYGKLKESRLKSLKNVAKRREGGKLLSMNRNFPHLETAWEIYREDPDKYKPESEPRRTKTPSPKKFDAPAVRGTIPKTELRDLERDVNIFTTFARKVEEIKPKLTSGELEHKTLLAMKRTLDAFKQKMEKHNLLLEDIVTVGEDDTIDNMDLKGLDKVIGEYKVRVKRITEEKTDDGNFIGSDGEEYDADELLEENKDYLEYLKVLRAMLNLKEVIPRLETILENVKFKEESLVDPPSEDTTEGSA